MVLANAIFGKAGGEDLSRMRDGKEYAKRNEAKVCFTFKVHFKGEISNTPNWTKCQGLRLKNGDHSFIQSTLFNEHLLLHRSWRYNGK